MSYIFFCRAFCAEQDNFQIKINEYAVLAKSFDKKVIPAESLNTLVKIVKSIIGTMKQKYIIGKLKAKGFVLRYYNNKPFPDFSEHDLTDKTAERVVKFTIAVYSVMKHLNDKVISAIIEKSPLEMVPLLWEIHTFLQFVSSNPRDFGHGTFLEQDGELAIIFASHEAICRIMKVVLYRNLLAQRYSHIYKLSRITSAFYRDINNKNYDEILESAIKTLKRSPADDSRIPIYYTKESPDIENMESILASLNHSTAIPLLPIKADFDSVAKIYTMSIRKQNYSRALSLAKQLCGTGILASKIYKPLESLCDALDAASIAKLTESKTKDGKEALKLLRESETYDEISKFLRIVSRFHQLMNVDASILSRLMMKDPDIVIHIAKEFVLMLQVLESVSGSEPKIEDIHKRIRDFVVFADDGTYILSVLVSIAMKNGIPNGDFVKSVESWDLADKSIMRYLKVH
ncbi:MAG: hypothetical protein LBJ92_03775 [Holosporales bacterium]|nr:hypothetical protein [Holosporales bacterium]